MCIGVAQSEEEVMHPHGLKLKNKKYLYFCLIIIVFNKPEQRRKQSLELICMIPITVNNVLILFPESVLCFVFQLLKCSSRLAQLLQTQINFGPGRLLSQLRYKPPY